MFCIIPMKNIWIIHPNKIYESQFATITVGSIKCNVNTKEVHVSEFSYNQFLEMSLNVARFSEIKLINLFIGNHKDLKIDYIIFYRFVLFYL